MGTHTGNVITLVNSIIGVSVLAMPFCFKQCGILLSILMLILSSLIQRLACHYLIKSAVMEKRKNFEMLAFRVYGSTGKLVVELGIIGFMLGTCVAFFVIMGDLGPAILAPALGFEHPAALRPSVLIGVAVFVVLPLGLLRNVDSLNAICAASLAFYLCLVLKVMGEATPHLWAWDWIDKVNFWRPSGLLQCIPIFSMALSCQTQLFEIFDSLPNTPIDRMNSVVRSAINTTTFFYVAVGFFGYVAYCNQTFSGNLMMNFSPSPLSDVIKIGFVMSVAVSFPLVIFPCRASIYSLLFSKGHLSEPTGSAHIPEARFQCITLVIVTASLITGLLIPNIELVLGLVGSTIGVMVCIIMPAIIFINISNKDTNERLLAKVLVAGGFLILVMSTYTNLFATEQAMSGPDIKAVADLEAHITPSLTLIKHPGKDLVPNLPHDPLKVEKAKDPKAIEVEKPPEEARINPEGESKKEPPVPLPPEADAPLVLEKKKEVLPTIRKEDKVALDPPKEKAPEVKVEEKKVEAKKEERLENEILEKIKLLEEKQKKINEEARKLLEESKALSDGFAKDTNVKVVNLKTGEVAPVKKLPEREGMKEAKLDVLIPKEDIVKKEEVQVGRLEKSMAKGLPLPLVLKGTPLKEESKVLGVKEGAGRDILQEREGREKREADMPLPTIKPKEHCEKKNSSATTLKEDTGSLLRTPSHLSDPAPLLKASLESEPLRGLPDAQKPLSRDLKSLPSNETSSA